MTADANLYEPFHQRGQPKRQCSGTDQQHTDTQLTVRAGLEINIVDASAWHPIDIDQLALEHIASEVDRLHALPPWVSINSGMAAIAATVINARKTTPSTSANTPFA